MSTRRSARICVYCGSSSGSDPVYAAAAEALGTALVSASCELVYGGGHVGLMGVVADAVLAAGGRVTGVMTEQLVALEIAHEDLTELDVQPTMHARKARMAELADGVIVLPGGFGTLDEAFELLTWNQLGIIATPVVFLDVEGFFSPLFEFIGAVGAAGFMSADHVNLPGRATTAPDAVRLAREPASGYTPKWVGGRNSPG